MMGELANVWLVTDSSECSTLGNERTMVFVETKRKADFIATFLCQEKLPTTSIHG